MTEPVTIWYETLPSLSITQLFANRYTTLCKRSLRIITRLQENTLPSHVSQVQGPYHSLSSDTPVSQFTQADYISTRPDSNSIVLADMCEVVVEVGLTLIFDGENDQLKELGVYSRPFGSQKEENT